MTRGEATDAVRRLGVAPANARRMVRYAYANASSFRPTTWQFGPDTLRISYTPGKRASYLVTIEMNGATES